MAMVPKLCAPLGWPLSWQYRSAAGFPQFAAQFKQLSTEYPLYSLGPGFPPQLTEVKPTQAGKSHTLLSPRTQVGRMFMDVKPVAPG